MNAAPELFRCEVYACRLTRPACAERHRSARVGYRGPTTPSLTCSQCAGCEIGAAHARGERPDVMAAQLVRPKTEVVVEMPKIVTHTHNGKTLALKDWAQEPEAKAKGLSLTTLRDRVNTRRMTIAQALEAPPGVRAKKAARKPLAKVAKPAALDAHLAKRAKRAPAIGQVSTVAVGSCEHAALVLTRLGYVVEDAGVVPAGRLILVRESAAA